MQTERSQRGGHAVPKDHPARKATVAATRRQLQAAIKALDNPAFSGIRHAQAMTVRASETLELLIEKLAAQDAEGHRRHATKLARSTKDARGRKRAPVTMPGYHIGRPAPNKGKKYPPTPPTVNEILRMLALAPSLVHVVRGACPVCGQKKGERHKQDCLNPYGERLRCLIYVIWRGGMRISCEALSLTEFDLHPGEGYIHITKGKGGKSRDAVVDDWVWPLLEPWLQFRQAYPPGPLFCVIEGPTQGVRPWTAARVRLALHDLAELAGIRHRVNPHGFRHAMALEQLEEGVNPLFISRQLGHSNLGVTDTYFKGLPQSRVVAELRKRPVPKVSMFDVLQAEGATQRERKTGTPDLMGVLAR